MARIIIALLGWALIALYLLYEYHIYGSELLSHFYHQMDDPFQFVFHMMIFLAPVITTYAAYLIHLKDKALKQRSEMEENLRIQRNQAQQYLDVAGVMLLVLDEYQNITLINKKGCEILGYQEGELIGNNWFNLCIPDRIRKDIQAVFDGLMAGEIELTEYYENPVTTKGGDERIIAWNNTVLRNNQNNIIGVLSSGEDITEKKKLEAQLLHAQKMESVGNLAGGIAHDFNNILSAIIAYGNLINLNLKGNDVRDHVDQILALSDRAVRLTKGLLAFSRKQILLPAPVLINDIVRNVKDILLRLISEDIELKMMLTEKDLKVMGDSIQIEQILMNLATNAQDAMPNGGLLTIETEYGEIDSEYIKTHGYGTRGQFALITVTDTGIGMDEETRRKIFEPFFTTKDVEKGTGLGLATIYGIVKQHNGFINVISELGKGASFKIYLPVTDAEDEVIEVKEYDNTSIIRGETILLAEDEAAVRKSMQSILESFEYRVIEAINGEDAVERYKENKDKIRLVILDVIMPKKNGKDVYEEIKKIRPDVKVLFISGYPADVLTEKGILTEGLNFTYKPVLPGELFRKIKEISAG
jgi:PAS domain S-box-containing protein